jgi:hypothetical protein
MAINIVIDTCLCVDIVCPASVEWRMKTDVNFMTSYVVLMANGKEKERGNKRESQMNQVLACFMLCHCICFPKTKHKSLLLLRAV